MLLHLHRLKFFAYHGIHEEEKIAGGEYEVNLSVSFEPKHFPVSDMAETIDYTALYGIVKQRMQRPTLLLETIAMEIANEIIAKFLLAGEVTIAVTKLHPPIKDFDGSVGVSYTLKREK